MSSHFTSIGLFAPNLPYPSHNFFPSPACFPPPPPSCIPFVSSRYSQVIPTAIHQLWSDQSDQIKAISGLLRTSTSTISYLTGDGFSRALTDSIWLSCHTHEDLQILYWSTFLKLIILHSREKKGFPTIFACVYHFTRSFSTIHEDAVCKTRHWIKQLFLLCFETCVRGFFHGCLIQWVNIANNAYIFAKKFDVSDEFFSFL